VALTVPKIDEMITAAADAPSFNPWRRPGRSRFGWPALVSAAVHVCLGLLVMHAVVQVPQLRPLIRVSFIDPAPPPPLGSGTVASAAPVQAPVVKPVAEPEHQVEPVQPKPVPRIHRAVKPAAKPAPLPPAAVPPVAAPATAPGASGQVDGLPGGAAGGLVGGLVGGTGHQLVSADQAAHQPILMKKVMPEYPPMARLRGVEGQVVLEAILSPAGDVEPDIKVLQSIPLLDAAAIAAVRQWHFRPAQDDTGGALRVTLRVPVRFVLR